MFTGASGFIGLALTPELARAGHEVPGLSRSPDAAEPLVTAGVKPFLGDLDDLDSLRRGIARADGVVHFAAGHDFRRYQQAV